MILKNIIYSSALILFSCDFGNDSDIPKINSLDVSSSSFVEESPNLLDKDLDLFFQDEHIVQWTNWPGDRSAGFSLTFDDGRLSHYQIVAPLLDKYKLKGTFFITDPERYLEEEILAFKEVSKNNHEIGNHGYLHKNFTSISIDSLETLIKLGKERVKEIFEVNEMFSLAYTFCKYNYKVIEVARKHHGSARSCGETMRNSINFLNENEFYELQGTGFAVNFDNSSRTNLDDEIKTAKSYVNNIRRQLFEESSYGIFVAHEVMPFSEISTDQSSAPFSTEALEYLIQNLVEMKRTNNLWVGTYGHAIKYIKQTKTIQPLIKDINNSSFKIEFQWDEEIKYITVPLTLKIRLPSRSINPNVFYEDQSLNMNNILKKDSSGLYLLITLNPKTKDLTILFNK